MKKKTPILELYYDFCKRGIPHRNGLCGRLIQFQNWQLLVPTYEDERQLDREGMCTTFWASEEKDDEINLSCQGTMTPLRQNIVLLLACLEGEL
jgi:hypothetical protein